MIAAQSVAQPSAAQLVLYARSVAHEHCASHARPGVFAVEDGKERHRAFEHRRLQRDVVVHEKEVRVSALFEYLSESARKAAGASRVVVGDEPDGRRKVVRRERPAVVHHEHVYRGCKLRTRVEIFAEPCGVFPHERLPAVCTYDCAYAYPFRLYVGGEASFGQPRAAGMRRKHGVEESFAALVLIRGDLDTARCCGFGIKNFSCKPFVAGSAEKPHLGSQRTRVSEVERERRKVRRSQILCGKKVEKRVERKLRSRAQCNSAFVTRNAASADTEIALLRAAHGRIGGKHEIYEAHRHSSRAASASADAMTLSMS